MSRISRYVATGAAPPDEVGDFLLRVNETIDTLGMPIPEARQVWTYGKIEKTAHRLAEAATENHQALNTIVAQHFSVIRKRWNKKSRKQRQAVLDAVWPQMPDNPCEDLQLYRDGATRRLSEGRRLVYLLPQANRHQLLQPHFLLTWILARGQHHPHEFLRSDSLRMKLAENGTDMLVYGPIALTGRLMHINVHDQPELYGKLIAYDNVTTFQEALARDDTMACGVGLLVLEKQAKLNEFLVKCCQLILHDQTKLPVQTNTLDHDWPELPPHVSSISTSISRRAFDGPRTANIQYLVKIVAARLEAMEDHLWAMREDPGYFLDAVIEMKDHVPVNMATPKTRRGGVKFTRQSDEDLSKTFPGLLRDHFTMLFTNLRMWTALHEHLLHFSNQVRLDEEKIMDVKSMARATITSLMRVQGMIVPWLDVATSYATVAFFASSQNQEKY